MKEMKINKLPRDFIRIRTTIKIRITQTMNKIINIINIIYISF